MGILQKLIAEAEAEARKAEKISHFRSTGEIVQKSEPSEKKNAKKYPF